MSVASTLTPKASFKDYWELTKPRLASLVMLSALVGFVLASSGSIAYGFMMIALVGTALVSAGSMTLNQWMEREWDAKMNRTRDRPIPAKRVSPRNAFLFGLFLSVTGVVILFTYVNLLTTSVALTTTLIYLLVYTPMKRISSTCTLVGAIPGALPPLIGWAAVAGELPLQAWVLFAILFFWQMPHFLAIAWLFREDFDRAGFRMLSVEDKEGKRVSLQIILYASALLPVSLLPTILGMVGATYFWTTFVLGVIFLGFGFKSLKKMDAMARPLFKVSISYLTLLFILMIVDKI